LNWLHKVYTQLELVAQGLRDEEGRIAFEWLVEYNEDQDKTFFSRPYEGVKGVSVDNSEVINDDIHNLGGGNQTHHSDTR
jgi:hypothetical protein